jgi:subtilisin-like proprotein convertase family protein
VVNLRNKGFPLLRLSRGSIPALAMLVILTAAVLAATVANFWGISPASARSAVNPFEPAETPAPPEADSQETFIDVFIPLIFKNPEITSAETVTRLFCSANRVNIPDNDPSGISSTIFIDDPRFIVDLQVRIDAAHTWVGDLVFSLTHQETGKTITLIDRPGYPNSSDGCANDHIATILDDRMSLSVENRCTPSPAAISGSFTPDQPLRTFVKEGIAGNWTLSVSDNGQGDSGRLNEWCLAATLADIPIKPAPIPVYDPLPTQAQVSGVTGKAQSMPLSCESRSAVDWANYFGYRIGEFEFFNKLPASDNPDAGFVGDVYGAWGQIPPAPYGVHAEPVAALLRDYGLNAYAHRPLSWDGLRAEIATGRPVIVWIIGSVVNGIPVYYTSSDGHLTTVARYEHTVIVTGYTETSVTYLNGSRLDTRSVGQFLESWSALGNMGITVNP